VNRNDTEVEAKFYLGNPDGLRRRLEALGAVLAHPRVHEVNLRFDLPDGSLTRERRVLRLRRDARAVLTYKGAAQPGSEVAVRQEIETEVADFDACRRLLEALGYQVSVMYEKYRATYRLEDMEIVLDELPYGAFCEIEAADGDSIHRLAERLGLDWTARITLSYLALFDQLKRARGWTMRDLSFDNLHGLSVSPTELGARRAD
jgi:adenylate cyclase class 2